MFKAVKLSLIALAFLMLPVHQASAAVQINEMAPNFTLTDSNGVERSLSDYLGKIVVLEWVNYECPFVVKHYQSNNMQNLQQTYTGQDIVWLSINSSAPGNQGHYPQSEINQIMQNANAVPTAYLIDENGDVGHMYDAQTTPHMYIINAEGKLIYQGAIDSIPSFDQNDIPNATNYVQVALDETIAGNAVSTPSTKSYGCSVKY